MKRTHREKEFSQLQKLHRENQKLKKQVSQLRKLIAKFDLDRYHDVKEIMEANERLEERFQQREARKQLEKNWECWDCGEGVLRLIVLNRRDGVWYFRKCSECNKRTKSQPYNERVAGEK